MVDTAGMRKRSKVIEGLEKLSTADARRSMGRAQVVMLIFDGSVAPLKQDFSIASMVVKEGRAPVIVLNKWDCVDNPQKRLQEYQDSISTMLSQAKGIPIITLSALNGIGVKAVMPTVLKAYERWNRRVPTAALNRWLADVLDQHPPPLVGGRRIKLRYVTQAKARPPTFAVFCNFSEELPDSYSRYLVNNLREAFDLPGVPIRLVLRKRDNPYIK